MNDALQVIGFLLNANQQKEQVITQLQQQLKALQDATKPKQDA